MMLKTGVAKITLLGDSTTGKTSIAYRMVNRKFRENNESTIGASFLTLKIDGLRLDIWDTAGQERYLSLCKMYYRNSDIFVLVYDINDYTPNSINRLLFYIDSIKLEIKYDFKIIIVGNKLDLKKYDENLLKDIKAKINTDDDLKDKVEFINISAKTGENFDKFLDLIKSNAITLNEAKKNQLATYNDSIVFKKEDLLTDPKTNWNKCPC